MHNAPPHHAALCSPGLSDSELLGLFLRPAHPPPPGGDEWKDLIALADRHGCRLESAHLESIGDLSPGSAEAFLASAEFWRRRIRREGIKITRAADLIPLLGHLSDRKQEHFVCFSLNGAHEIISQRVVSIGLVNSALVHPREVYSEALKERASAIIIAHNHPSGELRPSREDIEITARLAMAGELLGIRLLDHIVFSMRGFISFQEDPFLAAELEPGKRRRTRERAGRVRP